MTQRTFTSEDQIAFAKISGDSNPVHMDPILARRLLFGRQIVHGLHALLWGLDQYCKTRTRPLALRSVKVNFQAAIGVGQRVNCVYNNIDEYQVEIQLAVDNTLSVWAQIAWNSVPQHAPGDLPATLRKAQKCRERSQDDAVEAAGNIPLYLDPDLATVFNNPCGGSNTSNARHCALAPCETISATTRCASCSPR